MKRSTVAIKYLHALDLKNFELLSTLQINNGFHGASASVHGIEL